MSAANPQQSSSSTMLSEKVSRALQVRSDTTAMKAALDALAALSASETMDARSVRVAIEQDALQQANILRDELKRMVSQVQALRQDITAISSVAHQLHSCCRTPEVDESDVAAQLSDAFAQRHVAQKRLQSVNAFMDRYDLSAADSRLLDHYNFEDYNNNPLHTANGRAFLTALDRVKHIRAELTDSLDTTSTSALRMMESLAKKQENAYERLYRWFQSIATTEEEDVWQQDFVKQALFTLRHVPAFYAHTTELLAHSRRTSVTKRFLLALTAGPAPLEMKAHDPVTYVGDMLAFAFTTFSVEGDVLRGLLEYHPNGDDDRTVPTGGSEHETAVEEALEQIEGALTLHELWSTSISGLSRPLKSRLFQVASTLARRFSDGVNDADSDDEGLDDFEEEGGMLRNRIVQLYSICGLLLFYVHAIVRCVEKWGNTVSETNPLIVTLRECLNETQEGYQATTRAYAAMLSQIAGITGDSEASQAKALVKQLKEVRESSPGFASETHQFQEILSIEWATKIFLQSALQAETGSIDDILSLQESVQLGRGSGLSEEAANKLYQQIQEKEAKVLDVLVQGEKEKVLDLCGLKGVSHAFRRWSAQNSSGISSPMASFPGLSKELVELAVKDFYSSLYSPPLPSLETIIKDPLLRKSARSKIASKVADAYAELYEAVQQNVDVEGGYHDSSFLQHNPQQVRTLFSV